MEAPLAEAAAMTVCWRCGRPLYRGHALDQAGEYYVQGETWTCGGCHHMPHECVCPGTTPETAMARTIERIADALEAIAARMPQ